MCFGGKTSAPPPPPPLPPAPPPPPPPKPPAPVPEPVIKDVNPRVRQSKSKKAMGEYANRGQDLRIQNPQVSTPTAGPTGGLNQ